MMRFSLEGLRSRKHAMPRMVCIPAYVTPDQYEEIRRSGVPISRFLREAAELALAAMRREAGLP